MPIYHHAPGAANTAATKTIAAGTVVTAIHWSANGAIAAPVAVTVTAGGDPVDAFYIAAAGPGSRDYGAGAEFASPVVVTIPAIVGVTTTLTVQTRRST